ncbi:MAG: fructosamine kinase family protein [Cyanobium sp.]
MPSPREALRAWLDQQLGLRLREQIPVAGGSIHSAWCLSVEGAASGQLFAKTNAASALPLLEAEADGLRALALAARGTGLQVPQPLALGLAGGQAVLVLPWLEERRFSAGAAAWQQLGRGLARLHRASLGRACAASDRPAAFGWVRDNWIGSGPQANGWERSWGQFFCEQRIAPQARLLEARRRSLPCIELLLEDLPAWLDQHQPYPCLVHGDLWSGNVMAVCVNERNSVLSPAIFDPAIHRGDREVDLAMARLFGGFPAQFFEAYQAEWPLPQGAGQRVNMYNLYHLLNHANLFGGAYHSQACSLIMECLKQMADHAGGHG